MSSPTERRVCAWCMHIITDGCAPFTVVYAGRELHYCDTDLPDHSCYTDHLNGVTGPPRRSRDDRARRP